MRLFVLAGGFGTRLQNTIANVPKALAPIGRKPFLQFQIENWLSQGVREFTFLLHHQADQIIDFLDGQKFALLKDSNVNWIIEPVPLDTGGSLSYAVKTLNFKGDFLVTNADTWLGGGIREMIDVNASALAAVKLVDVSRYGQVHFDRELRVTAFIEKNAQYGPGWINAGLCRLAAKYFFNWDGRPFSLERDFFPKLVSSRLLSIQMLHTDFIDIGVPEDYHRFCKWINSGRNISLCN